MRLYEAHHFGRLIHHSLEGPGQICHQRQPFSGPFKLLRLHSMEEQCYSPFGTET